MQTPTLPVLGSFGGGEHVEKSPFTVPGRPPTRELTSRTWSHGSLRSSAETGTHVVPLQDPTVSLQVGDVVAYEFVSADRKWRWALGTIEDMHGPTTTKAAVRTAHGTTVYATRQDGTLPEDGYMLVTVRDWALSRKSGRPRRVVLKRSSPDSSASLPPTPSMTDENSHDASRSGSQPSVPSGGRVAGEKLVPTPLTQQVKVEKSQLDELSTLKKAFSVQHPDSPSAVFVDDAVTEEVAKAQTFVSIAWDSVMDTGYYQWEELLRLQPDKVPSITLLGLFGFLTYIEAIPLSKDASASSANKRDTRKTPVEEEQGEWRVPSWPTILSALTSPRFDEQVREFFLATGSVTSSVTGDAPCIRESASPEGSHRHFSPGGTTRAMERSIASVNGSAYHTLTEEQHRIHQFVRHHVLQNPGFRYDRAMRAGTLVGRIFKCVESIARYFDALVALEVAEKEKLQQVLEEAARKTQERQNLLELLTFRIGSTKTTTVRASVFCKLEGSCRMHEDTVVLSQQDIDAISAVAFAERHKMVKVTTERSSHTSTTVPGSVPLGVLHSTQVAAFVASETASRERIHSTQAEAFAALSLTLSKQQLQSVSQGTKVLDAKVRRASWSEDDSVSGEVSYLMDRIHDYADDLERTRYHLRQREAAHVAAVSLLQAALNDLLESQQSQEDHLHAIVTCVEDAVEMLSQDGCEQLPRHATPLPDEVRESMHARFSSLHPRPTRDVSPEPTATEATEPPFVFVSDANTALPPQPPTYSFNPSAAPEGDVSAEQTASLQDATMQASPIMHALWETDRSVGDAPDTFALTVCDTDRAPVTARKGRNAHTASNLFDDSDGSLCSSLAISEKGSAVQDRLTGVPATQPADAALCDVAVESTTSTLCSAGVPTTARGAESYSAIRVSPTTCADDLTPRPVTTPPWTDYVRQRRDSDARNAELERQEQEIVLLTAKLEEEQNRRVELEERAQVLEQELASSRHPSEKEAAATSSRSAREGDCASRRSRGSVTDQTAPQETVTQVDRECDYSHMAQVIHGIHQGLCHRNEASTAYTRRVVDEMEQQMRVLCDSLSATDTGDETEALKAQIDTVTLRRSQAQAEQHRQRVNTEQLSALREVVATVFATAQFHDDRWGRTTYGEDSASCPATEAETPERVTTSHTKSLPGASWSACIETHGLRAREAAVFDIANATRLAPSDVTLKPLVVSEDGLCLNFHLTHAIGASEEELAHRLEHVPFRALGDLYDHRDDTAQGADAFMNELATVHGAPTLMTSGSLAAPAKATGRVRAPAVVSFCAAAAGLVLLVSLYPQLVPETKALPSMAEVHMMALETLQKALGWLQH